MELISSTKTFKSFRIISLMVLFQRLCCNLIYSTITCITIKTLLKDYCRTLVLIRSELYIDLPFFWYAQRFNENVHVLETTLYVFNIQKAINAIHYIRLKNKIV